MKRGVTLTATVIAGAVAANAVQAAPVGLAVTVMAAAAKGAAASGSTLTIIKGALKIMAWTKAKTAIVVGASVLLAAGTTTIVVEKVRSLAPSIPSNLSTTDLSWADDPRYWESDFRVLKKLPPVMIIRPTIFPRDGGGVGAGGRMMLKNVPLGNMLGNMIDHAYDFASTRIIFPADMPSERYDLMFTLPDKSKKILQQELAKRFGYVAHKESRQADVLLLKVKNPNPPNLKPAQKRFRMFTDANKTVFEDSDIPMFCWHVEGIVGKPVLDRTGLRGKYDITFEMKLKWDKPSQDMLDRALLDQLGLELVPAASQSKCSLSKT